MRVVGALKQRSPQFSVITENNCCRQIPTGGNTQDAVHTSTYQLSWLIMTVTCSHSPVGADLLKDAFILVLVFLRSEHFRIDQSRLYLSFTRSKKIKLKLSFNTDTKCKQGTFKYLQLFTIQCFRVLTEWRIFELSHFFEVNDLVVVIRLFVFLYYFVMLKYVL